FTSAWLSAPLIEKAGSEHQKTELLSAIADGNLLVTVAIDEGKHHRPLQTAMTAKKDGEKYYLNCNKAFELDGNVADKIVVVARTNGQKGEAKGISLFLVNADATGLTIEKKTMMDSRNAAKMQFEYVAAELIKEDAYTELVEALDIARIGLAAEMLGSMQEAFERTIAYLKERKQFGVPIGVFQGLQHRAAWMFCEIEQCKSLVIKSLQAIDKGSKRLPAMASMTKAKVGETLKNVSNEAVQMYGGIGVTDDEEIGFFMKRARVAQRTLGDANYHLDRFASLNGF
ncbi:MAG: acyl-CoA dehydrogenase, partial [Saprospiraceae bacterium]